LRRSASRTSGPRGLESREEHLRRRRRRAALVEGVFSRPPPRKSASTAVVSLSGLVSKAEVDSIVKRLEKAERINAKLEMKEKEDEFKLSKSGCETQFKFNIQMKDRFGDNLKVELKKHFKKELPEKVGGLVKEVEKEIDDQTLKLKVADKFGFKAMEDFIKEDLARNEKEKKIKALRKEKRDREEEVGGKAGLQGSWFRGVGGRAKYFGLWESAGGARSGGKDVRGLGVKCFSCLGIGHVAKDCVRRGFESSSGRRGKK
jgi:hypothetical protein